jgi:retron-type reverse transcriptase
VTLGSHPVSPDIGVPVSLAACYAAWQRARRGKKPSRNQLAFEARWLDHLLDLHTALRSGRWQSRRTVSFIVNHPKTREIHAPDFSDRIVHHLLVERLLKLYEPVFIHDSFANRRGKGSHAAVDRLQTFLRQQDNMANNMQRGGWYLQLDIHNYFNSIHRPTLYAMLCRRIAQQERCGQLPPKHALALRSLCHKLLAQRTTEHQRDPSAALKVPAHKLLRNAAPGCGLPVGNLTSQFFANVYLNALDQFVKHTLKVRHYVRYVDDFVLLANSPQQLRDWQAQIAAFLQTTLQLKLRCDAQLQPCVQGIDFLGYEVFVHHRRVRMRVVQHCREKLQAWYQQHARRALRPCDIAQLHALLGSYWGHFAHAVRLRQTLFAQMPWLKTMFNLGPDAHLYLKSPRRWQVMRRRAVRQFLKPEGET